MLFCITGEYTPKALKAMGENPKTNRQAAVEAAMKAAGGKLVGFYGRVANGPGVLVIFEVGDAEMAAAMAGTVVAAEAIENTRVSRLFTHAEMDSIRDKRRKIGAAYKAPGEA